MRRWTTPLLGAWLSIAGRQPGCGMREAGCEMRTESPASRISYLASRRIGALLTIGRLHYDGGGDWYAGPSSLPNLLGAIRQRTSLPVAERERVVTLASAELWDIPYLFMRGHGNVRFSDAEVEHSPPSFERARRARFGNVS